MTLPLGHLLLNGSSPANPVRRQVQYGGEGRANEKMSQARPDRKVNLSKTLPKINSSRGGRTDESPWNKFSRCRYRLLDRSTILQRVLLAFIVIDGESDGSFVRVVLKSKVRRSDICGCRLRQPARTGGKG